MYLQLQLSLSHTQTHTRTSSSLLLSSTNHGETLRPCGILLCRCCCCGRSPPHITSSSHFAFTDIPAHSCTGGTFLCRCAHLHLIHVHTSPAKMCTLDNILLHDEHITLHFTLEKFFARDPRRIPRTKCCTSHSEDMNTVVFECHAQHISGSFAWFHNNAISSMTLLAASSPGFALLQLIRLYCTACIKMHTQQSALHITALLLPPCVSASCLLSGALTGIGSCLAATCYTSNLAELLLYWQLLQNWHLPVTQKSIHTLELHWMLFQQVYIQVIYTPYMSIPMSKIVFEYPDVSRSPKNLKP